MFLNCSRTSLWKFWLNYDTKNNMVLIYLWTVVQEQFLKSDGGKWVFYLFLHIRNFKTLFSLCSWASWRPVFCQWSLDSLEFFLNLCLNELQQRKYYLCPCENFKNSSRIVLAQFWNNCSRTVQDLLLKSSVTVLEKFKNVKWPFLCSWTVQELVYGNFD